MATLRQRTSFGPGTYRGHRFDKSRLQAFVEGTNKAIAAGVPIPLLKRHAPIGADDKATEEFAKEEGAGFITKVELEDDGSIAWHADGVPEADAKAINEGTVRHSSPEFRPHYECEKAGVYSGPVIRHWAFTPKPGNPHQGKIEVVALQEQAECWQFGEDERQPLDDVQFTEYYKSHDEFKSAHSPNKFSHGHFTGSVGSAAHNSFRKMIGDIGGSSYQHHFAVPRQHLDKLRLLGKNHPYIISSQHTEGLVEGPSDASTDVATKSMKQPPHDDPNDFGKSTDKSIDWDTLTEHERNKVLDMLHGKLSNEDHAEGMLAKFESEHGSLHPKSPASGLTGNPPSFAPDEGTWEKAKAAVGSKYKGDSKWAVITSVYKKMGGKIHHGSQHAEAPDFDKKDEKAKKVDNVDEKAETSPPTDIINPESPPENTSTDPMKDNPDAPPKATDKTKLAAVIAGLQQLGIVLPSTFEFDSDASIDILLASINTKIKADNDAEAEAEPEEDEDPVTDAPMPYAEGEYARTGNEAHGYHGAMASKHGTEHATRKYAKAHKIVMGHTGASHQEAIHFLDSVHGRHLADEGLHSNAVKPRYKAFKKTYDPSQYSELEKLNMKLGMQFTEEEYKALPPAIQAKLTDGVKAVEAAEAKAAAFEEERKATANAAAKDKALGVVNTAKIPPGLRAKLLAGYMAEKDGIQFAEGAEVPTFTAAQVAQMVQESLPPQTLQFFEDAEPAKVKGTGVDTQQFFEEDGNLPHGHISAERARELVNSGPYAPRNNQYVPANTPPATIGQLVAAENARVPNNVMKP